MSLETLAGICLAWYVLIVVVSSIGWVQLVRHYSCPPRQSAASRSFLSNTPHVTIIRPVKGLEPYLYECLAAAFHQDYPSAKLTIYICASSRDDPAIALIERLVEAFSSFDVKTFVEDDDPALLGQAGAPSQIGPNPKIRNMSRAYREAKGDIIWILDCNVWVGPGVCGRMVDKLCGNTPHGSSRPYKFVHQLPICVDVDCGWSERETSRSDGGDVSPERRRWSSTVGGRLEELFLSSSHAKFYTAINTVAIAPCIVGKSNMFRRSHLDYLTSPQPPQSESLTPRPSAGIDFFSHNICEDHLIGDLLWRRSIHFAPTNIANHALLYGDLAIQPISNISIATFIARRVRWLRVRKFTVTLATLVEPGTESLLCSAYGAYALTSLKWLGLPPSWSTFALLWILSVSMWALVDWTVYLLLHSGRTVESDNTHSSSHHETSIPNFARPPNGGLSRRPFLVWLAAWMGREALALPIWIWAFWGGVTVVWKDRKFWVGTDMKVHEMVDSHGDGNSAKSHEGRRGNDPNRSTAYGDKDKKKA